MTRIHLSHDLVSFFNEEISSTAKKQGIDISPVAEQYIAKVLTKFTDINSFLNPSSEQKKELPVLAIMMLESQSLDGHSQLQQLQKLGDTALFTSGFLNGRIKRSMVDLDYYMAMGGQAYEKAGFLSNSLISEKEMNVYFELASRFPELVELLMELSDKSFLSNDSDLLKLYQKWSESQSDRVARMLKEAGIKVSKVNS